MSAAVKKAGAKGAKALGVVFFLFLIAFNVQIATSNEQSSDINLLGLSLSVFTPSAVASSGGGGCSCTASETCPPRKPGQTEYIISCSASGSSGCSCTSGGGSVTCSVGEQEQSATCLGNPQGT